MADIDEKSQKKILGENISILRKLNKMRLCELATEVKYNRNSLSSLEYGDGNPQYQTLLSIAKKLNIDFTLLFADNLAQILTMQESVFYPAFRQEDFLLVFSENCTEQMQQKGISYMDVYISSGTAEATVSKLLNHKRNNPTWSTLYSLASACEMTVGDLFLRRE